MKKQMLFVKRRMLGVLTAALLLSEMPFPGSLARAAGNSAAGSVSKEAPAAENPASEDAGKEAPAVKSPGLGDVSKETDTAENSDTENVDENMTVPDVAREQLAQLTKQREIMALVYLADEYPVRAVPSYEGDVAVTVLSGQQVCLLDICVDSDYEVWGYVRLECEGVEYYGYVPRSHLAVSDERFLNWEAEYGLNPGIMPFALGAGERAVYEDIEQFPISYRNALTALKQQHPSWIFVKMNTTLDWNEVIRNEMQGAKSLVYKTLPDWAKNGLYDTGKWYYATEDALKVYMDPRNSLKEQAIFQFEQLTYNEQYHTLNSLKSFLDNTFMNSSKPVPGESAMTYADIFWNLGRETARQVSPFHLAARVLQEQGKGDSPLISGTYSGYEGYYNYFNVGASGTTDKEECENGLKYAKEHGWQSVYLAIRGGADFISANYIRKGQDTLYLQKFNVNPKGEYKPYEHQYMQNISAPTSEALSIRALYVGAKALDSTFVFKIPVFENMPAQACAAPGAEPQEPALESFEITLKLPEGGGSAVWLDGAEYQGNVSGGNITVKAADRNAKTAVIYRYNGKVPIGMSVWSLNYSAGSYTASPMPEFTDLLTYHGFSIRITGKSGIRFKTGISVDLRKKLTTEGVNGYRLKEYGTLVMNNANRGQYPMVKGGDKVQSGMAYGEAADGFKDVIYETVSGRYRYTSVLVGVPAAQYKREFAFRGYIVLEKNGREVVLYGPPMAKSIYSLAEQIVKEGDYEQGSAAYEFLTKLIRDAEAG